MKILHISSPKSWRGGEQQLIYLAEELSNAGVEQLIMCPFNSAVHKHCLKKHIAHITYFKGFSGNPMVAFRVAHVCKREHIDLIHVHDSHSHNFAVLSAVLANNVTPIIVSRRVDFPIQDHTFSLYKYNHPRIAKILCVSEAIKSVMLPFIEDQQKLEVVYSGIDLKKFDKIKADHSIRTLLGIEEHVHLIGNVAALAPHKDYFTFVDTAKKLIDDGLKAHFIALGDGPLKREIETYIAAQSMTDHISLLGFRTDVLEILSVLDLFLITSETEGLGTSILDALALKVPVVATAAGGIVEVISHEKSGLLCPVKDVSSLVQACKRMLEDEALRNRIKEEGWSTVQKFSKTKTAQTTIQVYRNVLSAGSET